MDAKVHYRIHNSLPPVPIWVRSIQSMPPSHFSKIRFNIILMLRSVDW